MAERLADLTSYRCCVGPISPPGSNPSLAF